MVDVKAKVIHNFPRLLPVGVFVGIVPCVIRRRAVAVGIIWAAATAARRVLAYSGNFLVGRLGLGLLGLIRPSRGAHVGGESLLAGNPSHVM